MVYKSLKEPLCDQTSCTKYSALDPTKGTHANAKVGSAYEGVFL